MTLREILKGKSNVRIKELELNAYEWKDDRTLMIVRQS